MNTSNYNITNNIAVIWDFDKTLTPQDSTTELIKSFEKETSEFWNQVKKISGVYSKDPIDSISSSEAPVWMYLLSEIAINPENGESIDLSDKRTYEDWISGKIDLYPEVSNFMKTVKDFSLEDIYKVYLGTNTCSRNA